jgi:SPP1 gp7 family putative phage head morphogenesis protein
VEGDQLAALARSVLAAHAVMPAPDTLRPQVYDCYAAGAKHAVQDVAALTKSTPATLVAGGLPDVDWSSWEPGDVSTAEALLSGVNDAAKLSGLLADAQVTIKSVATNRLGDLARAVADSIGEGTTISELTDVLSGILTDPSRAEMVARTETTRVMVAGAMDTYLESGIGYVSCLSAEDTGVCSLCEENEEAGVLPIWDQPPNGWPPAHPNCRCTVLPELGA